MHLPLASAQHDPVSGGRVQTRYTDLGASKSFSLTASGATRTVKTKKHQIGGLETDSIATRAEGGEVRALVSPRIVIETRPRPALGRLLLPARLSGVSIYCRLALGRLGGFGAGIRRRDVRRCRLDHGRLDIDHATRPAEIVGPSARRRERLAFGERAGHACAGGGSRSGAWASHQFFRHNARFRERHDRSGCWPL